MSVTRENLVFIKRRLNERGRTTKSFVRFSEKTGKAGVFVSVVKTDFTNKRDEYSLFIESVCANLGSF